jgi:Fe-S oxidoreductase
MSLQNYDVSVGIDAFELLTKLGYEVIFVDHEESGRAYISKGFLEEAKLQYKRSYFTPLFLRKLLLIGIEPSAILTFRDEYIRLADDTASAEKLAKLLDNRRIFQKEITGKIRSEQFSEERQIKFMDTAIKIT